MYISVEGSCRRKFRTNIFLKQGFKCALAETFKNGRGQKEARSQMYAAVTGTCLQQVVRNHEPTAEVVQKFLRSRSYQAEEIQDEQIARWHLISAVLHSVLLIHEL